MRGPLLIEWTTRYELSNGGSYELRFAAHRDEPYLLVHEISPEVEGMAFEFSLREFVGGRGYLHWNAEGCTIHWSTIEKQNRDVAHLQELVFWWGSPCGFAYGMGADGLVLHIGSHRGSGFTTALPAVADALVRSLDEVDADVEGCPILLENAAGAGDTVGRSFEELAEVIAATGDDERLGVCLDTQHLWASGIPFATVDEADDLIDLIEDTVGLRRLRCIHLNDSKVDFGANKDRHENIGDGTIGADGLAALLGHPDLQGIPAILEVPGEGDGPRTEDVTSARAVLDAGLTLRA